MAESGFEAFPVFIIALVVAGVVAGFGAFTNSEIIDQFPANSVTNDSITFTANNTEYQFDQVPVRSFTALYFFPNASAPAIPTARYVAGTNSIRLLANATTSAYPNITAGDTYYAAYTAESLPEHQVLQNSTQGIGNITSWYGILGTLIAAIAVLGLVGGMVYILRLND